MTYKTSILGNNVGEGWTDPTRPTRIPTVVTELSTVAKEDKLSNTGIPPVPFTRWMAACIFPLFYEVHKDHYSNVTIRKKEIKRVYMSYQAYMYRRRTGVS